MVLISGSYEEAFSVVRDAFEANFDSGEPSIRQKNDFPA